MNQEQWTEQIKQDIADNPIMVYAKGEKNMAACGFSHRVMEILNRLGVDYQVRNVLVDPVIRQAVSAHTRWPTIPQVFVAGEFIGGSDTALELYQSGELQKKVEAAFAS